MDSSIKEILKKINKNFGENVATIGVEDLTKFGTLSLGSPGFDFCLYNSFPTNKIVEFSGEEGSGKAQPLWSPVFTPNGYIKMGDVKRGTEVIDGKGNVTKVTGVYPRGKLPVYKVTFNDKTSTYCAEDHLWKVYNHSRGKKPVIEVLETKELLQKKLYSGCWGYSIDVPTIDCWEDNNIDIEPYLLGALIGDDCLCNNLAFSNLEQDVAKKVNELMYASCSDKDILHSKLNKYNLLVKSSNKHIPKNYLYSSKETRIKLLQGLFDIAGYTNKQGGTSFSTSSKQLAEDVQFLLRTLGCRVITICGAASPFTYNGQSKVGNTRWTLYIKTPKDLIIATSKKHLDRLQQNANKPVTSKWWRSIVNIQYVGEEECQCIMVDSEEHTYLTDDLICTHNTTSAYLVSASYQKRELKIHPNNPRAILFVDLECSADPAWAKLTGYDMSAEAKVPTICLRPEGQSAEQIFDTIIEFLKTGEVGLIIIDSLSMLVSQQVYDQSFEKKEIGGIAKPLGDFVKRIKGLLTKYDCCLIGINQVRDNVGGYGPSLITSGGRGWKHACDVRMMFKKGAFFDEEGNELTKSAQSPAGYIMEAYVLKTKVCRWDRKLGRLCISYTKGVDILQDTIDVAIYFGLIDNSSQGWFKIINPETGETELDSEGNEIKIRGRKNVKPYFEEHIDQWKKLYDKVYELISRKEDPNIVAFEKLLNIDINEKLGANINELVD